MKVILVAAFLVFAHQLFPTTVGINQETVSSDDEGDEDEWIDPYDFNYDHTSPTDWNKKKHKTQCTPALKDKCIHCGYDLNNPDDSDLKNTDDAKSIPTSCQFDEKLCPSSDFLLRHFARSLLEAMESSKSQEVVITLSRHKKEKLNEYIIGNKHSAGNIASMLEDSLDQLPDSGEALNEFYINSGITIKKVIIGVLVLTVSLSIFIMVINCQFSLYRVISSMLFTVVLVSCVLSYMYLYQKAISRRMADDVQRNAFSEACLSPKNASFLDNVGSYFKRLITTKDRTCEKLFEDHQIDIFFEVLPIDAITHTFGSFATSLAETFGASFAIFQSNYFANIPFLWWIPAQLSLLLPVAVVLAVYLYCRRPQVIIREQYEERRQIRDERPAGRIQDVDYRLPVIAEGGDEHDQSNNESRGRHDDPQDRTKRYTAERGVVPAVKSDRVPELGEQQSESASSNQEHGEKVPSIKDKNSSEDSSSQSCEKDEDDLPLEQRDESSPHRESLSDDDDFEVIPEDK